MTVRSPEAFFLSALLHGVIVVALLFTAYWVKDEASQTKVFELVAGEGDNYTATEAPALGTPGGAKVEFPMPTPPASTPPTPAPAPIQPPAPSPVAPAPVEAVPPPPVKPAEVKPADTATPDFAKNIDRIAKKRESRVLNKYLKEQKAAADKAAKEAEKAEKAKQQVSYEQFLKENGLKANPSQKAPSGNVKIAKIDAEGIAKGVAGGSTANKIGGAGGKALTAEQQDVLSAYFAMLRQRLRDAHEKPAGVSDLLSATAEFYLAADGSISRVRIKQSSGNAEFDQSVLAAFRKIARMPARPDGKGEMAEISFRMKDED